jgi:hypothetical protein
MPMMEWGDAPLSVKACYALLVAIGVMASIRASRLLLTLYAGPRERHTLRLLMAGSISAASAAGAGLAGKIDVPDAADAGTHPSGSPELARARLRSAEARFALGWRQAYADVLSMRNLAWLALILAATSVTWDLVDAYSREYDHRNYVPVYAVTLAASKLTTRLLRPGAPATTRAVEVRVRAGARGDFGSCKTTRRTGRHLKPIDYEAQLCRGFQAPEQLRVASARAGLVRRVHCQD